MVLALIPSLTEMLPILIIVLLLFGAKKIPELMRGLGQGIREFNTARAEIKDEIEKEIDGNTTKNESK